jgi:glyoxylase-like metal-dependent hydrolase (beta-lactamase superfamily II)
MKIAPGVYSLGDDKGGWVRAFLIDDGDGLTLIDTLSEEDGSQVLAELAAIGRKVTDLKRIILTHAHPSHLGGLKMLKAASGAAVYSHDWEADIIAGRRKMVKPPSGLRPMKPYRLYKFQVGAALGLGTKPFCEVDQFIKDGDRVGPLTVLHTPGHTPGSVAFHWPERRVLIVGDIVSTWPELALGWPQITLDNRENRESVGKLSDIVDADIVGVGHGDPIVKDGSAIMRELVRGKVPEAQLAQA